MRFDYHVQPCELERGKREVLDAAGRPSMRKLGDGAFRFSTSPALGGRAAIIEIAPRPEGGTEVRTFAFEGHPQLGWTRTGSARFRLSADEQRRLLSELDAALAAYRRSTGDIDDPVMIVCTDGPGYLTERIRGRAVETLAGSCPLESDAPHPNVTIACRLAELLRRRLREAERPDLSTWERCDAD
ncbi:MAG TPA: hypothetical protein VF782_13980 [Allosphingosinicella sp.]